MSYARLFSPKFPASISPGLSRQLSRRIGNWYCEKSETLCVHHSLVRLMTANLSCQHQPSVGAAVAPTRRNLPSSPGTFELSMQKMLRDYFPSYTLVSRRL